MLTLHLTSYTTLRNKGTPQSVFFGNDKYANGGNNLKQIMHTF